MAASEIAALARFVVARPWGCIAACEHADQEVATAINEVAAQCSILLGQNQYCLRCPDSNFIVGSATASAPLYFTITIRFIKQYWFSCLPREASDVTVRDLAVVEAKIKLNLGASVPDFTVQSIIIGRPLGFAGPAAKT